MTIAEIKGKISESGSNLSERMEDLLTSDVFGCLRYLPVEKGLFPFLKTAWSYKGLPLNIPFSTNKTQYLFWPSLRIHGCNPCEPDVLLSIETKQGIHLIMIEAKYFSGLSSEEDSCAEPNNQLARELDNLNTISNSHLGWSTGLDIISRNLIFITQDMKIPLSLLSQSLAEYQLKRGEGDIFWTSWRFLPAILDKQIVLEHNIEHKAIMEDILLLLQKKGLTMFCGVDPVVYEFKIRDFDFYHITPRKFSWPSLEILKPIGYTYGSSRDHYQWPEMPECRMLYEYKQEAI